MFVIRCLLKLREVIEATKAKKLKHVDLKLVKVYVREKRYPPSMT